MDISKSGDICEVREVYGAGEANELLRKGWILLDVGRVHKDRGGFQAVPYYSLGRVRNENDN